MELLSRTQTTFDPTTTLLGSNVKLSSHKVGGTKVLILMVHLKWPKEYKSGKGVLVELFPTDTFSCPASAFKKWMNRQLLGSFINYDMGRFLTHSFRAGKAQAQYFTLAD